MRKEGTSTRREKQNGTEFLRYLTSAELSRVSLDFLQRNGAIKDTEGRTMLILIDQLRTTGQRFS